MERHGKLANIDDFESFAAQHPIGETKFGELCFLYRMAANSFALNVIQAVNHRRRRISDAFDMLRTGETNNLVFGGVANVWQLVMKVAVGLSSLSYVFYQLFGLKFGEHGTLLAQEASRGKQAILISVAIGLLVWLWKMVWNRYKWGRHWTQFQQTEVEAEEEYEARVELHKNEALLSAMDAYKQVTGEPFDIDSCLMTRMNLVAFNVSSKKPKSDNELDDTDFTVAMTNLMEAMKNTGKSVPKTLGELLGKKKIDAGRVEKVER